MIITICGSYRFKNTMWDCYKMLTDDMHLVFLPAINCPYMDIENKRILHMAKIDESDAIYVVDIGGYVGEDTQREIDYAVLKGKEVIRYSENKFNEKASKYIQRYRCEID